MKINELKEKDLAALLNELFGLRGAKEIFAKHNVDMVTKETELQGIDNFVIGVRELIKNSKIMEDYKQAITFLNTQIQTNNAMLVKSEGFMKTMIEGMIAGFESTKATAIESQSVLLRQELEKLLDNILNEDDKKVVMYNIGEMTIDKIDNFVVAINCIKDRIINRYNDNNEEDSVKEKDEQPKETIKEKPKKKKEKVSDEDQKNIDDIQKQLENIDMSDIEETKPTEAAEEVKQEVIKEISAELETTDGIDEDDFDTDFKDEDFDMDFNDFDNENMDLNEGTDPF